MSFDISVDSELYTESTCAECGNNFLSDGSDVCNRCAT